METIEDADDAICASKIAPSSRRESEGFVAYDKSLEDVELTTEATNPIRRESTKKSKVNWPPCTPLKGIAGHSIQDIKIDDLRMFCSRNMVKGSRKAKKLEICWIIVKAKEKYDAGDPPPYKTIIPSSGQPRMEGGIDEIWETEFSPSDRDRVNKKRKSVQLPEVALVGSEGNTLKPQGLNEKYHYDNNFMSLQSRIVQSIEAKNYAIQLKEHVDTATEIRQELRDEKSRKSSLWMDLVDSVGNERVAKEHIKSFKKAKFSESGGVTTDGDVKGSYETLIEDIIEKDNLIKQLTTQHAALSDAISKLISM